LETQSSSKTAYDAPVHPTNDCKRKTKVLSTKIPPEDYQYKIFADEMFDGSMSTMVKTALRREIRANAVSDEKFAQN
jgi:hypothetical protein